MMKILSKMARAMRSLLNEFFIWWADKTRMERRFPTRPTSPRIG